MPGARAVAGYIQVPDLLRRVWSRQTPTQPEHLDIFEIEAVGPLLVLHNFGQRMTGHLWLHFIDNDAACATLVRGSSSVLSGELITSMTHELVAKFNVWPWFDRVDSESNPVDKLSRGVMAGDWDLVPISFPPRLERSLVEFLGTPARTVGSLAL